MTRHKQREYIFQAIFRYDFTDVSELDEQIDLFMEDVIHDQFGEDPEDADQDEDKAAKGDKADDSAVTEADIVSRYCSKYSDIRYIKEKTLDVISKIPELDKVISENCVGWTVEHMGKAELSILRLAVYEILFSEDVPRGVAINEAVNLAKIYCDEKSPSFINGVLAKIPDREMN